LDSHDLLPPCDVVVRAVLVWECLDSPFFFRLADSPVNNFDRVCLLCIFVRNRIYVLEVEMLEPVVLARNHKFDFAIDSV
jgi:hypothetical protein